MDTYEIVTETGETLAEHLTLDEVDIWWRLNERIYYGIRVVDDRTIVVAPATLEDKG